MCHVSGAQRHVYKGMYTKGPRKGQACVCTQRPGAFRKSEALYAAVPSRRLALESIQSAHSRTQLSIVFACLERSPPLTPAGRVSASRLSQRLALGSAVESTRTTHSRTQ